MVRKPKPESQAESQAESLEQADSQLAAAVKESAQQIWLAGLGAFAKAQQEGSKVFEGLVREGRELQDRTREATGSTLGEMTGRVTGKVGLMAGGLSKQATESWDRLEQMFEARIARALSRLGVPTHGDVQALIARVEALDASVQALGATPAARPARPGAARPTKARAAAAKTPRTPRSRAAAAAPAAAPAKARAPRKSTKQSRSGG